MPSAFFCKFNVLYKSIDIEYRFYLILFECYSKTLRNKTLYACVFSPHSWNERNDIQDGRNGSSFFLVGWVVLERLLQNNLKIM